VEFSEVLILSLLQGLTEFLPISSSAHLILVPRFLGYPDQGFAFDVSVHIGSLMAVVIYFRRDLYLIFRDMFRSLGAGHPLSREARLGWIIALATIPIVIFGELFVSVVKTDLRSALVIAIATIVFGLLLYWYDLRGRRERTLNAMSWRDGLIIGLFQVLAIIPGTSRSGITITAGLMLGFNREAAARFSFLLSIPTIAMSGILVTWNLLRNPGSVDLRVLFQGALLSFVAAYLCIFLFLKMIERIGMTPFVIYRLILGGLILVFAI